MAVSAIAEDWKPVPGFSDYEVSSLGRVRIKDRSRMLPGRWGSAVRKLQGHILGQKLHERGYLLVAMTDDGGVRRHVGVHAIVALAFHGPRPSSAHQCAHWDGDPSNNAPPNLRWATPRENAADKKRQSRANGGFKSGEHHHRAKLTIARVAEIRRRAAEGESGGSLAREFGVSPSTANDIIRLRYWRHVPQNEQPSPPAE